MQLSHAFIGFFLSFLLPLIPSTHAQIVISEVLWAGSDLSTTDEWVELTSTGSGTIDISAWTLSYLNTSGIETTMYRFGSGSLIVPGSFTILAKQHENISRLLEEPRFVTSSLSLLNTKLLLRLRNASGALVDEVDDGAGEPFAGRNALSGSGVLKASMERIDLFVSGTQKANWVTASQTKGFDSGALVYGTPGFAYSSSSACPDDQSQCGTTEEQNDDGSCTASLLSGIIINEVLPNPSGDEVAGEWVELLNTTDQIISLCGWFLDDAPQGSKPFALSQYSLAPGGYLVVPRQASKIALDNTGDAVRLFAPSVLGEKIAKDSAPSQLALEVSYKKSLEDQSYARDEFGAFSWLAETTPGSPNRFPAADENVSEESTHSDIYISSAKPNPAGADSATEWFEITNRENADVNLANWWVTTRKNSTKKFLLSALNIKGKSAYKLYAIETGISLQNSDDAVQLYAPNGALASQLAWQEAETNAIYRPNLLLGKSIFGTVASVIDGDTFDIQFDHPLDELQGKASTRVRLIGVDTPEITLPSPQLSEWGSKAKEFIRALIENKKVELQFDANLYDKYDRLLAYVNLTDGRSVQEELLKNGMAYAYLHFPFTKSSVYSSVQSIAKQRMVGIWSSLEAIDQQSDPIESKETKPLPKKKTATGSAIAPGAFGGQPIITQNYRTSAVFSEVYAAPKAKQVGRLSKTSSRSKVLSAYGNEWVELFNPSQQSESLSGWLLRVGSGSHAKKLVLKSDAVVASGSYFLVDLSKTKLKLSNAGTIVSLVSPDGTTRSVMEYPKLKDGQSFALMKAGTKRYCHSFDPTPGTANRCTLPALKAKKKVEKKVRVRKAKKPKKTAVEKALNRKLKLRAIDMRAYEAKGDGDSVTELLKDLWPKSFD